MRALPLTRAQAITLRAKLNTALGLPRVPTDADEIGGGIHVPRELCATTEACEILALADGTHEAIVPAEYERHLSASERTRLRAPTVRDANVLAPARDELLDADAAASRR